MIWFIKTSYSYVAPRGCREHVSFLAELPFAYARYLKTMKGGE